MHSRARKLPRCENDIQAINTQLKNDFDVQEYLHEHQNEQYALPHSAIIPNLTPRYSTHSYEVATSEHLSSLDSKPLSNHNRSHKKKFSRLNFCSYRRKLENSVRSKRF
jgi:hypothetical protein